MQQLVVGVQEIFFSVDCIMEGGRFLKGLLVFVLPGNNNMNRIIGKSARFGVDHHNFRRREIPEFPHPVRCPGPTGYVEGDISFPV
jgi:hypothetical protein